LVLVADWRERINTPSALPVTMYLACSARMVGCADRTKLASKLRYVPLHPQTAGCLNAYLQASGHAAQRDSPLFRPMINNRVGHTETALTVDGVYAIVTGYGRQVGIAAERFAPHALRATAATNALDHQADIAKVQAWLGHASIATTRIYDRRTTRPEDSPTFKVSY
jgi:integrase/recombinase XerD